MTRDTLACLALGERTGSVQRVSLFGYLFDGGPIVDLEEAVCRLDVADEPAPERVVELDPGPPPDPPPSLPDDEPAIEAAAELVPVDVTPSPARVVPCLKCVARKAHRCGWCFNRRLRAWVRSHEVGMRPFPAPADQIGLALAILDARPFDAEQMVGARDLLALALPQGVDPAVRSHVLAAWRRAFGLVAA